MSKHYENKESWQRVLFTILFWLIFSVSQFVLGAVVIAQCIFSLVGGKPNDHLLNFGDSLGKYIHEILRFVTYNTEQRPFPFTDFPKADIVLPSEQNEATS